MPERRFINQFTEQEQIDNVFRVADKQLRANRQGGKYILLRLADRTGNLVGMHWNADERIFESFGRGDYIRCKGRTQLYNGGLQMIVSQLDVVDEQQIDPSEFDAFDHAVAEQDLKRLSACISALKDEHLKQLLQSYLDDVEWVERFKVAPAAVNNHHAYPGGLLHHTVELMELAATIAPRYPQLNGDVLVAGAFLHDLGKIEELTSGGELSYTDRGQLIGHLVIGVTELQWRVSELEGNSGKVFPGGLLMQLEHMILSHHGQLEYGSPKVPMTLEAIALHHLDNLDAKMAAAISLIESDVSVDQRWTNFNPGLGRKLWKAGWES